MIVFYLTQNFDAADYFIMTPSSSGWRVRVNRSEGIKMEDRNRLDESSVYWKVLEHFHNFFINSLFLCTVQ